MDKALVGGASNISLWIMLAAYGLFTTAGYFAGKRASVMLEKHALPNTLNLIRGFTWGIAVMLLVLAFVLSPGGEVPNFIYFQF